LLDQRAELLNLYHIGTAMGLEDWRIYLHQTPMFHAASMGGVLGIPGIGGTSVFVPLFEPKAAMDLIEAYDVNWTMMVPTMIAMVLAHPDFATAKLRSLQDLVYGASPMPAALVDRITRLFPELNLWRGYGMTESSSVLTFLTDRDHQRGGAILRSAGRPVMGVNITIHDENAHVLPPGINGEVCARGGNFMVEYWNRPEETEKAFRGGWYHTRDEGHPRRRGLRVARRPGQGHDCLAWRECVLDRGGKRHLEPPRGRGGRRHRHPPRDLRGASPRHRRPEGWDDGNR
jgi:long-chain acyl-CoA synthetase